MKIFRNQKGIALMLVLSALVMITAVTVEFAFNTNVNYNLALNERDRLKAFYLAKSAYNFMLLELKYDRVFKRIASSQNLTQYLGENANLPLCQQFPLSTGLIRAVFTGGLAGMFGGEGADGEEGEDVEENIEDMKRGVSMSDEKNAQEFFAFDGDFDAQCVSENTKINLNGFYGLSTAPGEDGKPSAFDEYKRFLYRFLSQDRFDLLFEASDLKVEDVVDNIGDWVDTNTQVNEFSGRSGGAESSKYEKFGAEYSVRNGKLLTLDEAYLIDGVVDTWFAPLAEYFTIYGDGKFAICQVGEDIVDSLIIRFLDSSPDLPPLDRDSDDEMQRLRDAVENSCALGQTGNQLAQSIDTALKEALGVQATDDNNQTGATTSASFTSYIAGEENYYALNLSGQVSDMTVRLKVVLDIKDNDPNKWKLLYWRVY